MTDERYKKIMADLGMPNSRSLLVALQQVANEAGQECAAAEREACAKVCGDAVSSLAACPKSEKNEAAISALKQQACMIRSRPNAKYPAKPADTLQPAGAQQPTMPKGESAAAQLRAMATNYPAGHLWDKLDAKACIRGALEIEALRASHGQAPAQDAIEAAPMTKKELAAMMNQFIADQPDYDKDDWYVSSQGAALHILTNFAEFLGIILEVKSSTTAT